MALFRRKQDKTDVPSGLEPYYEQPNGWRLWVRRAVGVIAILLLLFLLVWAVVWVYRSVTDDTGVGTNDATVTENENGEAPAGEEDATDEDQTQNGGQGQDEQAEEEADREDDQADEADEEAEEIPATGDSSGNDTLPATGG